MTTIRIVDINPAVIEAAKRAFADFPQVECMCGSMLDQAVDVWVTPTNSKGNMSGGLDAAIRNHLGEFIQMAVKAEIANSYDGHLPIGAAICIETKTRPPRFLVSTPTMEGESDDLRRTKNTALACAAAFQAIYQAFGRANMFGDPIQSVAIPGLGAGTGKVDPEKCASLMLIGYKLFLRKRFTTFNDMLLALNEELIAADMPLVAEAKGTEESHPSLYSEEGSDGGTAEEESIIRASFEKMTDAELRLHAKKVGMPADAPRNVIIDELTDSML
jgi:O-acetyl-ADP-ribose deacetylase (regulator of RNase III)